MRAVVYDLTESRSGQHPLTFLGNGTGSVWNGSLVCDDYSGYKALFLDDPLPTAGHPQSHNGRILSVSGCTEDWARAHIRL